MNKQPMTAFLITLGITILYITILVIRRKLGLPNFPMMNPLPF